ncbi:MAG: PAS domain S-box protein, partial [Planctomycetaceae bacterium]|nr:PAS domain S-box protein [Planctomycetaceae bacterium]
MSSDKSNEGRHHPLHDAAVLGIALALLLDSLIGPVASLLLFFGAVAAHAWSGGMRPGLLAATLVALIANHFLPESHGRSIPHPVALALLLAYTLEGILAGTLCSTLLHDPRTRAETNARESWQHPELSAWKQERFRLFFESSPLSRERFLLLVEIFKDYAIFMLDPDGHFVSWSAGAERLTGYPMEEVLGRHASTLSPVEAIERGDPESELAVAKAEGRCEGEGWRLRKDGSRFWAQFGISALRDEAEDLRGFAVVMRDITERKRAEEKFRLVVESAPNAMVMVDRTGRIVLVNAQTEELFGYRRDELLGQPVELLVPEWFRGAHPDHHAGFYAHPEARAMGVGRDLSGRRQDGSEFPVEIGLNPIATDEGLLVLSAIVDITERRRAEEELRRAHDELEVRVRQRTAELARANDALQVEIAERTRAEEALRTQSNVLRSILDNLPAAVLVADEDERLTLSNPAAEQMFGHDAADASCPGWWRRHAFTSLDGVAPVAADALPLTRVIRGEELNDVEYFVRPPKRPEGVWISINGRPLRDGGGQPCGGLIVCRDVTELKRVAAALREAKEVAEAANRAKDQFLAILSHELRTPLTPVLLAVSALLDEAAVAA